MSGAAAEILALALLAAVLGVAVVRPRNVPEVAVAAPAALLLKLGALTVPIALAGATVALWLALQVVGA